jgi:DNA-binding NtrC family response regulator
MDTGKSILIVDDEENLRSTLTLILERAGYTIRAAANGNEALSYLRNTRFDLAFLDLKMPGIDGMHLLPEIRHLDPDLPVLILTANGSLDTAVEALRAGACGYLLKPVEPLQIVSRISEIFEEHRQSQRRHKIVREIKAIISELDELEL